MKTAGIIAEYNPFHNGHAYHIRATRESGFTHIVAAMAGNYTQRGEPACAPKRIRCEAAQNAGADLVIELPLPWAAASAERFAYAGVFLMHSLGCVDALSFGSECGDIGEVRNYARLVETVDPAALKENLGAGMSFPRARALALSAESGPAPSPDSPNDTLGAEYCNALRKLGSPIVPVAIKRSVPHNGAASGAFASASYIRELLESRKYGDAFRFVPEPAAALYSGALSSGLMPLDHSRYRLMLLSHLRRMGRKDYKNLPDVSEGLENRIERAVRTSVSLDGLYESIKTKRYTLSRIRRVLLYAFLGIGREEFDSPPPYIRVLGFNARGAEILSAAKRTASLPIVTKFSDIRPGSGGERIFNLESRAADLFSLCLPSPLPCGTEKTFSIVKT